MKEDTSREFGIASVVKSIGLPMTTEGYVIDYFLDGEWKHCCGVLIANGENEYPGDLELAKNIIESNKDKGTTKQNVSHIMRILGYEGDPNYLELACVDIGLMSDLLENHEYRLLIVNKEMFKRFNEDGIK